MARWGNNAWDGLQQGGDTVAIFAVPIMKILTWREAE